MEVDWDRSVEAERALNAYIDRLANQGVQGWVIKQATELHAECGKVVSLPLFVRYLKKLELPKRHTQKGTQYAIFVP